MREILNDENIFAYQITVLKHFSAVINSDTLKHFTADVDRALDSSSNQ